MSSDEAGLGLPACALGCVTAACPLSDLACVCGTGHYGVDDARSRCIIEACGFPESLAVRNGTATACGAPERDASARFDAMVAAMFVLTTVLVVSRLVYRQFFSRRRRLALDDWLVLLTALVGVPCVGVLLAGLNTHGLGRDAWALPPGHVAAFARYFYVVEIMYLVTITLVRLTLTIFYLDIFSARRARLLLWATVVFHVASAVAFVVKVILQCLPVEHNWTRFDDVVDRRREGRCVNIYASTWANAALGVAVDLWLLAIPLTQLKRLNLHWKKKVGATLMFIAGTIGTVISILRLRSIFIFGHATNPTWDYFELVWWSLIEVHVGMMCTCLPTLRLILVRMWPHIFGAGPPQPTKASPGRAGRPYGSQGHLESATSDDSCPWGLYETDDAGARGAHLEAQVDGTGAVAEVKLPSASSL